jgi:hypothetical protein
MPLSQTRRFALCPACLQIRLPFLHPRTLRRSSARRVHAHRADNGEYLDIEPGEDGAPARFVTVPVSNLRHAFRIHRTQDSTTRRWNVEVEPVLLAPPSDTAAEPAAEAASGTR